MNEPVIRDEKSRRWTKKMQKIQTLEVSSVAPHSWCEIDLNALAENIRAMRATLRPGTEIIFVVKANAYGHGMVPVAQRAAAEGVRWFAVAHFQEAVELRASLADIHILVLGDILGSEVSTAIEQRIIPVVVSEEQGMELASAAQQVGNTLPVHLKIDTGMGRLGVSSEHAVAIYQRLKGVGGLDIQGLCTHFASVEVKKPSLAPLQIERFLAVEQKIRQESGVKLFRHVASSRAFQYHREWDLEGVRSGILLYGYGGSDRDMRIRTRPILQWKSRVVQIKKVPANFPVGYYSSFTTSAPTTIATVAVGYADGYHRALSNRGYVLIRGKRCAVVGRISMNWITVDAGPDSDVVRGDEVVLIGEQNNESVWASDLARLARTIPYEMLTSIHPAMERRYIS